MSSQDIMMPHALTAAQWERVKGELRVLIAILGSVPSNYTDEEQAWQTLEKLSDAFIKEVEDNGLTD